MQAKLNPHIYGFFSDDQISMLVLYLLQAGLNARSSSKYFEIRTNPLRIYENFEEDFVDTSKRQTPRQLFNRF